MNTSAEKVVDKRKALGRGLDSLLPGPRVVTTEPLAGEPEPGVVAEIHAQAARGTGDEILQIPLDKIEGNPYQTRRYFDEEALRDLASSIAATGLVQPIVVRPKGDGKYALILGERRCRASKLAGKTTISAIVREVSAQQAAEMTVVENLQRQDLDCIEQAEAFAKLSSDFHMTQGQIGDRVGLSRESVANYMRLLRLPQEVREYMQSRDLGFSEARELLKLDDGETIAKLAKKVIKDHWTLGRLIDEIETISMSSLVRPREPQPGTARWIDPNVRAAARELERILGVRVRVSDRKGKGTIRIEYATLEDFDRVVQMLKGKK